MVWIQSVFSQISSQIWINTAIVILVITVCHLLLRQLRKTRQLPHWLDSTLDKVIFWAPFFILAFVFMLFGETSLSHLDFMPDAERWKQTRKILLTIGVILVAGHLKGQFFASLQRKAARSSSAYFDSNLLQAMNRVVSILLGLLVGVIILDILGVPLSAFYAFGGVGGIAFSLAAKDVIANFFGGLMIYVNRPFLVGDWIKSSNKNFEGVVEEIGWYRTKIRSFERRPTYVPNSVMTDAIVENPGRMYNRRIKTTLGLRYKDLHKIPAITRNLEKMLREHPAIDQGQIIMVHFMGYGEDCLNLEMYCFTKTTGWKQWREEQQDVFMKVGEVIHGHGADFAFPTRHLYLEQVQT